MPRHSSRKRRTTSCALCRKRKVKCDARSWPCGPCKKAGVSCVGGNLVDDDSHETPRSLVLWLEGEIARLEGQIAVQPQPQTGQPTRPETPHTTPSHQTSGTLRDAVTKDMKFPWLGLSEQLPLPNFVLFSDARLPSSEEGPEHIGSFHELHKVATPCSNDFDPLKSIPKAVADFLLEVYISRVMPLYPIFYEEWLRKCHATVIHASPNAGAQQTKPYDVFTISIIMAVSLSTAAQAKQARANEMAFKLFQHAVSRAEGVFTNDYAGLQAVVLVLTYATMNPAAANINVLAGYMMQTAIDLGLHREDLPEENLLERDLKRRLFWTAWGLDVSYSGIFTRPVMLTPKLITTGYPSDLEDAAIHPTHIDFNGRPSKFVCGRVRSFRQILVEVITTLFHGANFAPEFETLESWMDDVERRIHAWRQAIHNDAFFNEDHTLAAQWEEMVVFADIADPLVIVTLYRPCPRIKNPLAENLLKAFNASISVAQGYTKQATLGFGNLKYIFQPCHHVFSAAMVFLHVIRECSTELATIYSLEQMENFMAAFPEYFCLTSERWPALARCKDEYQRLLEPAREHYMRSLQLHTPEQGPDMHDLDDYLHQSDPWLLPGDSITDYAGVPNEFNGPGFDDLLDVNPSPTYWDQYFDLEVTYPHDTI